jgi:hypothetical protein
MAEFDLASGVTVEHPETFFARGSIVRGVMADLKSPIAYGYEAKDLPVYFNQDPVLAVAAGGGGFGGFGGGGRGGTINGGAGQNVTPNAVPIHVSPLDPSDAPAQAEAAPGGGGRGGRGGGRGRGGAAAPAEGAAAPDAAGGGGGGRGGRGGFGATGPMPRVIVRFPANANDMLLSGTLGGGDAVANHALAVDVTLGKGHIVMFALRPFWRWQTQGTYMLAFNAILNWDHLDAGKPAAGAAGTTDAQ